MASVYFFEGLYGLRPVDESHTLAREAIEKALEIDPAYATALSNLGLVSIYYENDPAAAVRYLEKALRLEPSNTTIISKAARMKHEATTQDFPGWLYVTE